MALVVTAGLLGATSSAVVAASGDITTIAGSLGEGPALGVAQQPSGLALRGTSLYVSDPHRNLIRVLDLATGLERVVAGTGSPGSAGDGGPAKAAGLVAPEGMDIDSAGNLYVADTGNNEIRKIDPSGRIATVAGKIDYGHYGGDGGRAIQANLSFPMDVAVDGAGSLYIADYFNYRVRKVDSAGVITTVAGNGTPGYGGDGGPATLAQLDRPSGVAVDGVGNVYVADSFNNRIRKIDTAGIITTVAGNGTGGDTGDGGPATAAATYQPQRVELDSSGNLYLGQTSSGAVRRVDTAGTITTVAGGSLAVPPGEARLGEPRSMAFDGAGNLYVAGVWYSDYRVHKVTPAGTMTTIAGNGSRDISGDGGPAIAAQIGMAPRLALGPGGDLYVAEIDSSRVRRIDGSGTMSSVARADFNVSGAIAFDTAGNLYVAEPAAVRRIEPNGRSTVVAGTGAAGFSGDGGPSTQAQIAYPTALAFDAAGRLFIVDSRNERVRRVGLDGVITTVVGGGAGLLGDGGPATSATLDLAYQSGLAIDSRGNLLLADTAHDRIRRVGADGTITTVAGNGNHNYLGDGGPATAADVYHPGGMVIDGSDNFFVVDIRCRVRKVDTAGVITTVAGNGSCGYSGDGGRATSAEVDLNAGNQAASTLAVDGAGSLLIGSPHHVRRVTSVASAVPALPGLPPASTSTSSTSTTSTSTTSTSTTSTSATTTTVAPARTVAWGLNHVGQLGDGTTNPSPSPSVAGVLAGTAEVSAGYYHSVARRDDGTVWAWGWNAYGQLGDGTTVDHHVPAQVPGLSGVRSVAAGGAHTLAVRDDGTVWAWGWNVVGQLGTGSTLDSRTPVQIPGLTHVVAVAAGTFHNLALRDDGTIWAWGWNGHGQLGTGTTVDARSPVPIAGLGDVRAVSAGGYHSLALLGDGSVRSWGGNAFGQVGDGTTADALRPVTVAGISGATSVAAGGLHSLASLGDGTVRAWGWNGVGQLGDGTTVDRHVAVTSGPVGNVRSVATGVYHSLALGSGGSVSTWGWNAYCQLGDGTAVTRTRPVLVPGMGGSLAASGGLTHTLLQAR